MQESDSIKPRVMNPNSVMNSNSSCSWLTIKPHSFFEAHLKWQNPREVRYRRKDWRRHIDLPGRGNRTYFMGGGTESGWRHGVEGEQAGRNS